MSIKNDYLAENRAIYLPAISETFARSVHRSTLDPSLPLTARHLNFLDPGNPSFFYPFALYSAGQAASKSGNVPPCMVTSRDRDETIVVGDSGGYQIQTQKIEFDPASTPRTMLKWLEQVADWSMVLDFPTGGISSGAMRPHAERLEKEGYDLAAMAKANGLGIDFNACLTQTKLNNDIFLAQRTPGKTRLLNVLQGRNKRESKYWYDAVKHLPFEGWALAGAHRDHFSLIVHRLLDMHADGLLRDCKWIHVLGVGSLQIGCLLTVVQRAVRQAIGNAVQFSFDSATPFLSSANGLVCSGCRLGAQGWSVQYKKFSQLGGSNNALLFDILRELLETRSRASCEIYSADTLVSRSINLSDMQRADGMPSTDGGILLTHHNVQALLDAHSSAQALFFRSDPLRPDPTAVPLSIKTAAEMVRLLFEELGRGVSPTALHARVDEWQPWLDEIGA
ncbi:hypothetical protein [Sphingomonas humi]|uniref:hypothetical protein n=1 Tax=Sphingomonas humi TaxID=335630 RepID=UPI0031D959C2